MSDNMINNLPDGEENVTVHPERTHQKNKKKARKKKKRKSALSKFTYVLFVLGASMLLSAFILLTANDVFALIKPELKTIVEVKEDVTVKEMADILGKNGVIEYPWAFNLYSTIKKYKTFESGKFELDSDMDYGQIINSLKRVASYTETVTVTIPEGYTLKQIAQLMEDSMVCSEKDFLETAATYPYKHDYLQDIPMEEFRLEGFLFPDTYEFYKNDKPVNVINKMLNNFDVKYSDDIIKYAEATGYTMEEIITIASMVEREAVKESEQKTIAGVIINRLENSAEYPFLNIDATVQYALPEHKAALSSEDLKIDSPYNTYIYKGLPKGPICNPGMGAILAAIQPEDHNYYYYVATGEEDGGHIFTRTLEEHNNARAEVEKNKK
ncbi:MAG: endolytic transglycosylase MltG [Clostridia bacterium]|nr:endolytic transglycosylase MltG [Clostridia bacterium]